ncbi:MAG TPA: amino acid adenylation domain-containing protein, partial [Longimicrobium sp.]|nr:amino acid adenylation domain-containing protein [Longimicrobium sp.]
MHELFEAQVARTPDAPAVVSAGRALTYAELNRRANQVAHHLRSLGVEPDARVAVCMERGVEMVVGLLGILKAGGAYVPLDPAYPVERLRHMLGDSAPVAALTQSALAGLFAGADLPLVEMDAGASAWSAAPETNPERGGLTSRHLAYVIYTSGSTGKPKGVAIAHRNTANFLAWGRASFERDVLDRTLFTTSLNFDLAVFECFVPLTVGASVHVYRDALALADAEADVTLINTVPSAMKALVDSGSVPPSVHTVNMAGEPLKQALVDRIFATTDVQRVCNLYGPSETTTYSTWVEMRRGDGFAPHIGRPIANTQVYILDAAGEPMPVGVAGELCIGGAGVARGYLNRPALTADRFVPDPFASEPGERLYRTGDLARWLPAGTIEFLGRNDHQVKVRGFRIELGEIEARLAEHADVRESVVVSREDVPGDTRLVAYFVGDEALDAQVLRSHLAERLPEHMVPAAFVRLDAMPLTQNGKLDRKALPSPEGDAFVTRGYEPPVGEAEEALAGIWAELLGVERVGRWDNYFELGGHSLRAVQLISRVRQVMGMDVALGEVFERPVLADFARTLQGGALAALPAIEPADRTQPLALSFAQQRLWFLDQLGGLGTTYHIPTRLRLHGALDRDALRRALDGIVARHETLRTVFHLADGEPEQRITSAEKSGFELVEHDLAGHAEADAELRRLMTDEATAPFDLARGPLIRGRLIALSDDDHVLLVTLHHIVSDGWSMGVLVHELSALYGAFSRGEASPLPALPVQYADYAAWQRRWVTGDVLRQQSDYWTATLADAPALLELPADRARPALQSFDGALANVVLDEALTAALKALSRRHGTTLFMTLLAGWAAVLGRLSGQTDLVVGTPSANRGRAEIEGMIGFFINTLALRLDLSGSPTVGELLGRTRARALEAQQHQDIPFEQVVDLVQPTRSLAHSPLFQVMFTWQNAATERLELPGLTVGSVGPVAHTTARFDLSLALGEAGGRIVGAVAYATALFDAGTVERHLGYLRRVLEEMVADDARPVERLALLPPAERAQVVEAWNATDAEYPRELCVHELVEAQAARTPDAVALVFAGDTLSYAALNARANKLAHHLRTLGVGPDARVAICVERGLEMVVGLLGVLKSGGAYVPLDPAYPVDRLRFMLEDSAPAAVLTQASLGGSLDGLFTGADVPVLDLDTDGAGEWSTAPETNPDRGGLTPEHLAYVIYTSGSTGRPKGVAIAHRNTTNFLAWGRESFDRDVLDRTLFTTSLNFDLAVFECFVPLTVGASVHIVRDALALATSDVEVTLINTVPSAMKALVDSGSVPRGVHTVNMAGEPLKQALVERIFATTDVQRVCNLYGPSETTTYSTWVEMRRGEGFAPHVGRPIHNTRVYVLDARGEPVPVGVAGELCIGGEGVARGYLNRPALTADRFVPNPFSAQPGARLYRTGDLARWRPGGTIDFLGRNDHQVKVRGFRIELGEIEARLAEHPGVREAVVMAREDVPGDTRLVAYYVGDDAQDAQSLRTHLSERLPEYMLPAAFVWLEALPLTPNGKLDRKALPSPEGGAFVTRGYEAPLGEREEALAAIWSELLGVDRVGRWDNYFELGGHSLRAVQLVSRVRQALGMDVALGEVFERPVLADFARGMDAAALAQLPAIEPADRDGRLALSFAQQRLWFIEQLGGLGGAYHIPSRLRLRGTLDRDALVRALDRIVERHEALRTVFHLVDGEPEQRIVSVERSSFHLLEHDLAGDADAKAEVRRILDAEATSPFALQHGPMIRGRLVALADDDHVLLVTMHHIVSDGWSMGVFVHELSALYGAFSRGEPDPLPALPLQYADYAAWQRRWVTGDVLQAQTDYWVRTLAGVPELLELPLDHPRPPKQDFAGAVAAVELDEALSDGLRALSRRNGTTLFMTLLAGWAAVMGRLSGQTDVVIGTPTANRGRTEVEGMIGFFINTLALRLDLSGSPTVAELLGRTRVRALEAQHHQDIPFEQVVELVQPARSLSHTPLFQVMFAWQNAPAGTLELPGLTLGPVPGESQAAAKFDLSLSMGESAGRIAGSLTYATTLFERDTVGRYVGYLRRALEEMVADDRQPVERLAIVSGAERRQVVEAWNDTAAEYPADVCIHALFEAQAERAPGATAIVSINGEVTYAEMNARANRLAHHLRTLGVGPDARVAICVERGPEMIVGMLAVLKAGGAYVPMDPAYPVDRLRWMLDDSAPAAVLTQASLGGSLDGLFTGADVPVLDLDTDGAGEWASAPETNPSPDGLTAAHLAYVIYTSGSTGRPKGVAVAHRSLSNLVAWHRTAFGVEAGQRSSSVAGVGFDAAAWEIWPTLCAGAALLLPADARDPEALLGWWASQPLDVGFLPTPVAELAFARGAINPHLKTLLVGGDRLRHVPADLGSLTLVNNYGPTETTVVATSGVVEPGGAPHIGRPIANTRVYLVDGVGQPVPLGAAGELFVGGAGVARGYLGQPGMTAERFVPDPFSGDPGARLYRTGDRARWLADGTLDFLGRADQQVKVRGFRIELGEIEARLAEHASVREAVVAAREDGPGDTRLVAYYVGDGEIDAQALRAHLSDRLPDYMLPAAFVALDGLPLTPNGKLDRTALPAPEGDAYATRGYEAPVGETEVALAAIWAETLGVERVGRWDNFFELGGHSLRAVQIGSRVRQVLGVDVALGDLFVRPALADFARGIEGAARTELPAIEPVARGEGVALSFAQQRLWFLEQLGGIGATYNIPTRLRLRGELDRGALLRALERIVARHEALRTTFHLVDGEPEQRMSAAGAIDFLLVEHDVSGAADALAEVRRLMAEEGAAPFDLEHGPLIRGRLVRLADDDHVLLVTMHHIVSDGWSMGVFIHELGTLYRAFSLGQPDPLP